MNLKEFKEQPFLKDIKHEKRWTVSTASKMPLDINALKNWQKIMGATFKNGNEPLSDLESVYELLPDATNATYSLNQALDDIMVLDIEPVCPEDLKQRLMKIPCLYMETSASGKGVHMVLPSPVNTEYEDIRIGKPALKSKDRYYEILLNHYVMFTGNMIPPPASLSDPSEAENLFIELAKAAPKTQYAEYDISELPEPEEIPYFDEIVSALCEEKYKKTPYDFGDEKKSYDFSGYEFGMTGFYNSRLSRLLNINRFKEHDYTIEERMVILNAVLTSKLEYRAKHDMVRDGLPWLLYTCKRVLTTKKN